MKERERAIVTGLVVLMLVLWLGFAIHRSPRFAGSLAGGILGVIGALLMLVPLVYSVVKRSPSLKKTVTRRTPMRTVLAWHIYAGIAGPIIGLLHSGHRFDSPLGIALTALMLIVVLSGFVGRYLMSQISREISEKRKTLARLEDAYQETAAALARHPERNLLLETFSGFFSRLTSQFFVPLAESRDGGLPLPVRAVHLADSVAAMEYAVKAHQTFKSVFSRWLKWHLAISCILYVLLGAHIWLEIRLGLRWFG